MDPVCGMTVDASAPKGGSLTHAGRPFYFCSNHCREAFAADPGGHLSAACPVCGATVARDAAPASEWNGEARFFCSTEHRDLFLAHPVTYGGEAPESDTDAAIYTCPMHPEIEQKGPGSCPICGMALSPKNPSAAGSADASLNESARRFWICAALTVPLVLLAMGGRLFGSDGARTDAPWARWLQLGLALPVVLWGGTPIFSRAWMSVRSGNLNMYTLLGLGTGTALFYSLAAMLAPGLFPVAFWSTTNGGRVLPLYFESAAVILSLALLGDWLELRARSRSGEALKALLDLQVATARRIDDGGVESDVDLKDVNVGDRLRVRPGETVPVDGSILEGNTWVDESRVSGESVPVAKAPGDAVTGATLNGQGAFVMAAEHVGKDSLMGRIVAQVAEAQRSRAPIQRLADRAAAWFVPVVIAVSVLSFTAWSLWGPQPRLAYALLNAVAVLIVACPCALGLATPMSIMVGTARAAQLGVLFRNAEALEALGTVDVLCVDKTGTLTEGRPRLVALVADSAGGDEGELLSLAAALERHSEHPLARAVLEAAKERGVTPEAVEGFLSVPGSGVQGRVAGKDVRLGSAVFCGSVGAPLEARAEALRAQGSTVLYAAREGRVLGLLAVADPVRAGTPEALLRLKKAGLRVVMLSGDAVTTAMAVGRGLGLTEVRGGLSPLDKAEAVKALQAEGMRVAMAGDGVNDAPALASASVGIAMGTGTDAAKLSAGVTLVGADLRGIARAVTVSRGVLRNIRQNLVWAVGYNALGVPIAAGLLYPFTGRLLSPMFAAAAMSLSSVSVIFNALRLRSLKAE